MSISINLIKRKIDSLMYGSNKSIFIVFVFSVLLAFLLNSYINEAYQTKYSIEWGNANWITTQGKSNSGYFRHSFTLKEPIQRAHIAISATEEFDLAVNGNEIGKDKLLAKNISGIFDISNYLQQGKNVVSVSVTRHTKKTLLAVIAKIKWQSEIGNSGIVISDKYWKSRQIDETFHVGESSWREVEYNDLLWNESKIIDSNKMDQSNPIITNPTIFEIFPNGHWLTVYNFSEYVNFVRTIQVDKDKLSSVWLGVSANGTYSLTINNVLLSKEDITPNKMNLMDISPYVIDGENKLTIQLFGTDVIPTILINGVVINNNNEKYNFSSDIQWTIEDVNPGNKLFNLTRLNPSNTPILKVIELNENSNVDKNSNNDISIYSLIICIISLLIAKTFINLSTVRHKINRNIIFPIYTAPYITAILLIVIYMFIKDSYYIFEKPSFLLFFIIGIVFYIIFYYSVFIIEINKKNIVIYPLRKVSFFYNNKVFFYFSVLLIVSIAFFLRIWTLDDHSFFQDESTILQFTHGLLERGYPSLYRDQNELLMVTYELVPYFIAASISIFGDNEFAARLPSVLFSMGTLLTIIYIGQLWYSKRVAILAGLLFAITPWAIFWAQNCFYPSQVQFFALLTSYIFIKLLKTKNNRVIDWYLLAIFFCCTYLTWEGSGLLLLVFGLMWLFDNRWDWLKNFHLWMVLVIVGSVVFFQLYRRTMLKASFVSVGSSHASISTPQLAFTQSGYDGFYYLDNIFFSDQYLVLSCYFIIGFLCFMKKRKFKHPYFFVLLTLSVYTFLLPATAIRYVYFVLPFFILTIAATTIKLLHNTFTKNNYFISDTIANKLSEFSVLAILILSGGSFFTMHNNPLKDDINTTAAWEIRNDILSTDYRGIIIELEKYYKQGDIVITRAPFLLDEYSDIKSNYSIQSLLTTLVVYGGRENDPYYRDKWMGNPVIRSAEEFKDILFRNNRVWLLVVPSGTFLKSLDSEITGFFKQHFELKAESDHAGLYLWER